MFVATVAYSRFCKGEGVNVAWSMLRQACTSPISLTNKKNPPPPPKKIGLRNQGGGGGLPHTPQKKWDPIGGNPPPPHMRLHDLLIAEISTHLNRVKRKRVAKPLFWWWSSSRHMAIHIQSRPKETPQLIGLFSWNLHVVATICMQCFLYGPISCN